MEHDFKLLRDIIKDEYGNYYISVKEKRGSDGIELFLVNAFVMFSYRILLGTGTEPLLTYEKNRDFTGKIAHDTLVSHLGNENVIVYNLDEARNHFKLNFIDTLDFDKNPKV